MERLTLKISDQSYAVKMQDCKTDDEARKMLMDNFKQCCNKLGKLEDLEEQTGMPLEELFEQCQLYQQALYLAYWGLAEYDDKGTYDEMEASDEWKEIIMKEADKRLEELKNEKSNL